MHQPMFVIVVKFYVYARLNPIELNKQRLNQAFRIIGRAIHRFFRGGEVTKRGHESIAEDDHPKRLPALFASCKELINLSISDFFLSSRSLLRITAVSIATKLRGSINIFSLLSLLSKSSKAPTAFW